MHRNDFEEMLEGCRRNLRASQHRVFDRYYGYAMSVATRYLPNTELAEEAVNDAFFKVFTKIAQFVPGGGDLEGGFRAWLRRIVINTAIDRLRVKVNQPQMQEWTPAHEPAWDAGIVESLTEEQVFGLLDCLPPAYRTVFNLHVVDGCTHDEIATMLGITVGSSKSNLSRARNHLKVILADDFEVRHRPGAGRPSPAANEAPDAMYTT